MSFDKMQEHSLGCLPLVLSQSRMFGLTGMLWWLTKSLEPPFPHWNDSFSRNDLELILEMVLKNLTVRNESGTHDGFQPLPQRDDCYEVFRTEIRDSIAPTNQIARRFFRQRRPGELVHESAGGSAVTFSLVKDVD